MVTLLSIGCYAQSKTTFVSKIEKLFKEKQWDSILLKTAYSSNLKETGVLAQNNLLYYRGYAFEKKGLYKQAEKEYKQITPQYPFFKKTTMHIAQTYLHQNKYLEAIAYFKSIDTIVSNEDIGSKQRSAINHNLGICYLHLKNYKLADFYLQKTLRASQLKKDTIKLISNYGNMATLYYEQYMDSLAIPYFKKAYHLAQYTTNFDVKQMTADNMAIIEENKGNLKKALQYRREYEQWKDSLNDQNKVWEIAELNKKHAIHKINLLKAENETKAVQRNFFIASAALLLLILGTGAYFFKEKIKSHKIITQQKEDLDSLNATKNYLFSVVSHDLRSPVNMLRKQQQKITHQLSNQKWEDAETTSKNNLSLTEGMHNLLNNVLHWSLEQSDQLIFDLELQAVSPIIEQVCFDFEQLAIAKEISLNYDLEQGNLAFFDRESLKTILRNILDNAIKYTPELGSITIRTKTLEGNTYAIEITDTGKGFTQKQLDTIQELDTINTEKINRSKGVGLGLLLCKTLAQKNNGHLQIENRINNGSKISILLTSENPKKL